MSLPAFDMADALVSGLSGPTLVKVLHQHFPTITRGEVFTACAIAASICNADILALEAELADARRRLGEKAAP
jgi:hypothetical protein